VTPKLNHANITGLVKSEIIAATEILYIKNIFISMERLKAKLD